MDPSEKYRIIEQIGGTSRRKFGAVYLCEEKQSNRPVILKTLKKDQTNQHLQRLLAQEGHFSFQFEGLPETLDYFESEHEIFVFKSFQSGIRINDYLYQFKGKERINQLYSILLQLEGILNYLHQNGVYHLDIKPGNLLIDASQPKIKVSLIDFGLAWNKNSDDIRKTLFPLGFAAPELLLNQFDLVDHRTDYYALGITCWSCLEGKIPLLHANPSITTNLQLTHPLPELNKPYNQLSEVIQKMAAKMPFHLPPNHLSLEETKKVLMQGIEKRYSTYREFLQDFEIHMNRKKRSWKFF